ncbi:hypothetical protein R1sor_015696 [Riccia sorocarpa]|uniref:Uncharacterized protein n=1 Tax=Riccia sorocarpa TaxID=122646 RepID=A0ABD3HCY9_9MARC
MGREDVAYVDAGGPAFFLDHSVSPASSCNSSSSNSEMKPRAMAWSLGAQKNTAMHRMTKQDYEMIGFVKCSGVIMEKKVARYVETYKKARTFYMSTGSGLTDAEIAVGLTLEQKMNAKCHYFFRMHALLGARANVEPPAIGDARLPAEMVFDVRDLCQDSQTAFQFSAPDPMLSEDEEEAADKEEEPIDLSEDDKVDNQTAPVADGDDFFETAMPDLTGGDEFYQTAHAAEDGGPEMRNQTGRSAVDVETNAVPAPQQNQRPQQSRGDASVQSVDDVRSSGKTVRSRDIAPPLERRTSPITAYEEQVKEKLVLRKEAQDQKASFKDAILEDRRQAREQREINSCPDIVRSSSSKKLGPDNHYTVPVQLNTYITI